MPAAQPLSTATGKVALLLDRIRVGEPPAP